MLTLWQTIEGRPDLELLNVERRSLAKHPAFQITLGNRLRRLVPDALFLFRQPDEGMCCCCLELDNGTLNAKGMNWKFTNCESA